MNKFNFVKELAKRLNCNDYVAKHFVDEYNKLVDEYNTLAERHNEVVRENAKNINIIAKIDDLVKDEKVNVYPLARWRPQKCKG